MRSSPEIMHCLHGVKLTPAGSEANIICRSANTCATANFAVQHQSTCVYIQSHVTLKVNKISVLVI